MRLLPVLANVVNNRSFLVVLLAVPLFGCGYFRSGVWENDAKNWQRAFHTKKPDDVVVVHSKCWRTPHFTYEGGYYFEIQNNEKLKKQLFTENKLLKTDEKDATEAKDNHFEEAPSWFTPKSVNAYDIYIYQDEPRGNFRVLVDKETGEVCLTDYQI
jgi:hypothetical protein